jgi:hypothetical protein
MMSAALVSPATRSRPASAGLAAAAPELFGLTFDDLDSRIPPAIAHAGADHLVLGLRDRGRLAAMRYDFDVGRGLALREGIVTFSLVHAAGLNVFHARNPFPIGSVTKTLPPVPPRRRSAAISATSAGRIGAISRSRRARTWGCAPGSRSRSARCPEGGPDAAQGGSHAPL